MKIPNIQQRAISPDSLQIEGDRVTVSFSSEYPARRFWGTEVLDHSLSSVNLDRLRNGKVLFNHDPDKILGKVERAWIENRRGYAEITLKDKSDLPEVAEQLGNIQTGFLDQTSIYYEIFQEGVEQEEGGYRIMKWSPIEITFTPTPVDPDVGLKGRFRSQYKEFEIMPKNTSIENNQTSVPESPSTFSIEEMRSQEENRWTGIRNLANQFNEPSLAETAIRAGTLLDVFKDELLKKIAQRSKEQGGAIGKNSPTPITFLGETDGERKLLSKYRITKLIRHLAGAKDADAGLELEVSQEICQRSQMNPRGGGLFIPYYDIPAKNLRAYSDDPFSISKHRNFFEQRAVTTGPASAGQTVATEVLADSFIDLLRNQTKVRQMGITDLSGLMGNISIPGQATAAQTEWLAENAAGSLTDLTTRDITAQPHRLQAATEYSDLLLKQSTIDAEQLVRQDLVRIVAIEDDRVALNGSGTGEEPLGILNTPGINSIDSGVDGGPITYSNLLQMMVDLMEANTYQIDMPQWMIPPLIWKQLSETPYQSGGIEGNFILGKEAQTLLAHSYEITNQLPSDLTKGAGTDLSSMILAIWSQLVRFEWGVMELLVNPYAQDQFLKTNILVRCHCYVDYNVRHAGAFSIANDIDVS